MSKKFTYLAMFKNIPIDVLIIEALIYIILPPFINDGRLSVAFLIGGCIGAYLLFLNCIRNATKIVIVYIAILFGIPNQGVESTGGMASIIPISLLVMTIWNIAAKVPQYQPFKIGKCEMIIFVSVLTLNFLLQGEIRGFYTTFIINVIFIRCFFATGRINYDIVFDNIKFLFYLQFVIIILERFFSIKVYQSVLSESTNFLETLRCAGYTGHPLVLSTFFIFYSAILFIRSYSKNRFYYIDTLVLIIACILLASRTPIIIISFLCILNFILYQKRNKKIHIFVLLFMGIISSFLFRKTELSTAISYTTERIASATSDQRKGAFLTAIEIVKKNPLGIGMFTKDKLRRVLQRDNIKSNYYFDKQAAIIDNSYLSIIISFGCLGLLIFYLYYSPIFYLKKRNNKATILLVTIGFTFTLLNFSFDAIFYSHVMVLYFLTIGYINISQKQLS